MTRQERSKRRPGAGKAGQTPRRPPIAKILVPQQLPLVARVPVSPNLQSEDRAISQFQPRSQSEPHDLEMLISESQPPSKRRSLPLRISTSWQFWIIFMMVLLTGLGGLSVALLLKLPAIPNCPAIFWPTASASLRLYCAQIAANKQTVSDLLEAIALVNTLPPDHPLRPEINRNIEDWSQNILNLAEKAFNRGKLENAIATAKQIPTNTSAHQGVEERIQHWRSVWKEAESIYNKAEAALLDQDPSKAFALAVRLLSIDNTYWQTTRYQELNALITASRQDGNRLSKASNLAERGGLSNLLAAIKLVEEIRSNSPAYPAGRRLIAKLGQKMMDLAESVLDRQDSDQAIDIVRQIPKSAGLEEEAQDFVDLALAQAQAWAGTTSDLESAILQAQKLQPDRPLYSKAQQLISRWQLEIQDVSHLDMAQQMAQSGTVEDLGAAIAEAELIPRSNPRRAEARDQIRQWTAQIQEIEDRPQLDQADQLASGGDLSSLQAAIDQASQIREGRALYPEARRRIQDWTSQIQRTQDQPYIDRARQLAASGNLPEAIATVQQIQPGRALSSEARTEIRTWRNQIEGQQRLQEAYQAASSSTPNTLLSAIRLAEQVPASSPARTEADRMINVWSQSILRFAQSQAEIDPEGAIATAESIPPRTEAYAAAQLQIEAWRQSAGARNGASSVGNGQ